MKLETSEQIGALVAALSKAQAAMAPAVRDTANDFYGSKYAPLASVWAVAQGPLTEHGLAVLQPTAQSEQGLHVITILAHAESGQWVRGYMPVQAGKGGMQALGSAITYARRYALAAMVGVVTDDDDGEASEGRQQGGGQRQQQGQRQDAARQQGQGQGGGQRQQSSGRQQQGQQTGQQRQGQQQSRPQQAEQQRAGGRDWSRDIDAISASAKASRSAADVQDLIDTVKASFPDEKHPVRQAVRNGLWKRLKSLETQEARHG